MNEIKVYWCENRQWNKIESKETDEWYEYFDDFASLLDHPKSLVRNRALYILAVNAQWDEDNHFDAILDEYLAHITDAKPITARQIEKDMAETEKVLTDFLHTK